MQHPDDLPRYVALGLTPSYFTNHTYFWGDVHRKNLGETRAAFISPMAAAMDAGLKATNHTDFNVTPLNPVLHAVDFDGAHHALGLRARS